MNGFVTAISLLLAVVYAQTPQASFSLSYDIDADLWTLDVGSQTVFSNSATATSSAITVNGTISILPQIQSINSQSALPSNFASLRWDNSSRFAIFAVNHFLANRLDLLPLQIYFGGSSSGPNYTCDPANPTIHSEFSCYVANTTTKVFTLSAVVSNPDVDVRTTLSVFSLPHMQLGLNVLFYTVRSASRAIDAQFAVLEANTDRNRSSLVHVGIIFAFIGAGMICLIILAAIWQAFFTPIFACTRFKHNTLWWCFIFFVIVQVLSLVGGFPGFIAACAFALLLCTLFFLIHSFHTCCCKNRVVKIQTEEFNAKDLSSTAWLRFPKPLGKMQLRLVVGFTLALIACMFVAVGVFYAWESSDYQLWDRTQQLAISEFQPQLVAKTALAMYAPERVATIFRFDILTKQLTSWCGLTYRKNITAAQKKALIHAEFIAKYSIDMSEYEPEDYTQYTSVNDWFVRKLKPGKRPIAELRSPSVIVSPADARVVAFESVPLDSTVWVKNEAFSLTTLLDDSELGAYFAMGSMFVVRLAPQDYHRFHSPIDGRILSTKEVRGTILSVNADAATSNNNVYYNERKVTIIESPIFGRMAYVAVGATCVGSVIQTFAVGQNVTKGDELGFMQFGGSTVILVFRTAVVRFDADIAVGSRRKVETLVRMGQRIGVAR